MAENLLPIGTNWSAPRFRTFTSTDHPSVVIEEAARQMLSYWGTPFVAGYLRRVADKLEKESVDE